MNVTIIAILILIIEPGTRALGSAHSGRNHASSLPETAHMDDKVLNLSVPQFSHF